MMKKIKSKAGMTLMEVLASLLVMVLLVVGMGTGMDAGLRVYADAQFESHSASLAGFINTALTDTLRYAQDIEVPAEGHTTFTNLEYGLRDAYLAVANGVINVTVPSSSETGITSYALINSGAYDGLQVSNFSLDYYPDARGAYFEASYKIISTGDVSRERPVQTIVRLMN